MYSQVPLGECHQYPTANPDADVSRRLAGEVLDEAAAGSGRCGEITWPGGGTEMPMGGVTCSRIGGGTSMPT